MPGLREELQTTLGTGYRLQRELGGGGMSRVFLAEDASLGRPVVVKVLAPDLVAGINAERFRREIQLSAQLQHPHVVPVLSAGEMGGIPFFVMPYVQGQSLRARLRDGQPLPVSEAVGILRDVAKALSFAHEQGIVHRDIKPDNVLISGNSAMVTDFGIAKAISSARVVEAEHPGMLTLVGTSLGTPAYMAPEQAAGDPSTDHRADIYAFGIMAYELLTGHPPFHDRSPHQLLTAQIAEPPAPLTEKAPGVPPALAALVMQCLEKHPANRPASAAELLAGLDGHDISGDWRGATGFRARARRGAGMRRRITLALLAVAVIAVAAAATVASRRWWGGPDASLNQDAVAVLPFRVSAADPSLHYLREGMLDLLAVKLTGDGGLRASEPRTVLDAWRRAGGSDTETLPRDRSLQLARALGAGRLLLGDVVGTSNEITINATLLRVPGGAQLARVSVSGPPDSLAPLVDRLAARLLTEISGEGEQRMASLQGTSLPALRHYLSGQSRLRRGDVVDAARDFGRALDEDSTFALAGLGLRLASSWYGDPTAAERGLQTAWRSRARLSVRDQALLDAVAGPRYPERSSTREIYEARQRLYQLAPDRAEAVYHLADHVFHYGPALGITDWRERAFNGFKRAMELDSTYVVGYIHALPLAVYFGDTATAARVERLRLQSDTSSIWQSEHRWYAAHHAGDTEAAQKVWADAIRSEDQQTNGFLFSTVSHALFDGTGTEDAYRSLREVVRRAPTDAVARGMHYALHDLALAMGRPSEARAHLATWATDTLNRVNELVVLVRDGMIGDGDLQAAEAAAARLAQLESAPIGTDTLALQRARQLVRVMEPWRLARGDTSLTARSLERMRQVARRSADARTTEAQVELALIEAMYASVARAPDAGRKLEQLDSLLRALDYEAAHEGRTTLANLVAARLFEQRGDLKRAYAAAGRRKVWLTQSAAYLATQLREEGRLAALGGDREAAIRAYRHYLGVRANPEPALRGQVDAVRRELARLERTDR